MSCLYTQNTVLEELGSGKNVPYTRNSHCKMQICAHTECTETDKFSWHQLRANCKDKLSGSPTAVGSQDFMILSCICIVTTCLLWKVGKQGKGRLKGRKNKQ